MSNKGMPYIIDRLVKIKARLGGRLEPEFLDSDFHAESDHEVVRRDWEALRSDWGQVGRDIEAATKKWRDRQSQG